MKRIFSTMAILILSGGLALAQGAGGAGGAGAGAGAGAGGAAGGATGGGSTVTPTNPSSGSTLGMAPGANPSNPQDLTNRGNMQDQTLPGASDRNDMAREPAAPRTSPPPNFGNGIRSGPLR